MSTSPKGKSGWAIVFFAVIFITPLKVLAAKEPVMRVLIGNESNASFRADGVKFIFVKGISSQHSKINSIKLTYNKGEAKYSINKNKDIWFRLPNDFNLTIRNNDKRGIWFKNRRYAGELRISLNNQRLQITNHIKLEKYLKSVVGSEMPKEFPLAALQAQAIAARTYALQLLGKNKFFDVHATQTSQVYLGLEAETPKINQAVRSTNSLALFYKGKLINAVFHSSSGGRTEDSGQVWKYQLPYLISVNDYDQNGSRYKWFRKFNSNDFKRVFTDLGGLNSIQVIKKSNSNRVKKVIVYGPKGNKIISGQDLRKSFNLNSTKFDIYLEFNQVNKERNFNIINYSDDDFNLISNNQIEELLIAKPLPSIPGEYFLVIEGFGYGHGVGLSQWGANAMAKRGDDFRKILRHYYSGVKIKPY